MTELDKRHRSSIYDSMVKSPNRAMLRATGMTDKDFETPIVGVISTWAENTPCNIHLHDFGKLAKEGVKYQSQMVRQWFLIRIFRLSSVV